MPDWTGTRARADALTVPCTYCHAPIGQPCINIAIDGSPPLWYFAAHQRRIAAAAVSINTADDEELF